MVGRELTFVEENHSRSACGFLRGLHYQVAPKAQAKLITVMRGLIFDAAVAIRPDSPTFGQWVGEVLTNEAREMLWILRGVAHGFYVLSGFAHVFYKTTEYYSPERARCIWWNDADLGIAWPLLTGKPKVSAKDSAGRSWVAAPEAEKL